ncbi:hypothetical protein ACJ73_03383 [Blastomyces percursus]|uniref:HTH CENPB-type domain-containing protein n=1 Tax=Blastomyces percursus TaxID=1658174 RepID=A0A1J9R9P3_9EURO|nr:hypothetical protein ACJ73_03383 [Blastomyces percursus]
MSRKEAISTHCKNPSDSQEEQLHFHINRLADRGFPCTPQILHNVVIEILKSPVGVNWVPRFCQRHKDVIKSLYFRNVDQEPLHLLSACRNWLRKSSNGSVEFQALNEERRRRKRGRAMGLLDPSNPSTAQFFSPAKVQSIREQMTAAGAAKKDEQAQKEDAKLQRTILKEQKKVDIIKQRAERDATRQAVKKQREIDKTTRAAQQQVAKELRDARKTQEQKEKEERAALRLQSWLEKTKVEESKNQSVK